jgi:hypothetical protein
VTTETSRTPGTLSTGYSIGVDNNSWNHERMETTIPGNRIPGRDFSAKILNNVAARGDTQLFDHLVSRGADPHHTETTYVSRVGLSDSRVVVGRSHLRARISRVAIW